MANKQQQRPRSSGTDPSWAPGSSGKRGKSRPGKKRRGSKGAQDEDMDLDDNGFDGDDLADDGLADQYIEVETSDETGIREVSVEVFESDSATTAVQHSPATINKSKSKPKKRHSSSSSAAVAAVAHDEVKMTRSRRTSVDMTPESHPTMRQCRKLLKSLMTHKFGWPFNQPVDPVALNLPDYFTIIKHPMDFGTIEAHLEAGQYRSKEEFGADVELVFRNALTYNQPGSDIVVMATAVKEVFDKKFSQIIDAPVPVVQQHRNIEESPMTAQHHTGLHHHHHQHQPRIARQSKQQTSVPVTAALAVPVEQLEAEVEAIPIPVPTARRPLNPALSGSSFFDCSPPLMID